MSFIPPQQPRMTGEANKARADERHERALHRADEHRAKKERDRDAPEPHGMVGRVVRWLGWKRSSD